MRRGPRCLAGRLLALLSLGMVGCAQGEPARTPASITTTPSGIPQLISTSPAGWSDSTAGWTVVETIRYGGPDGTPGDLVDPNQIALDDEGRVYVADTKPAVIKVFERSGRFLRTIGREGRGPGEFLAAYVAVRGHLVVVHDPEGSRTQVFDTSGRFLHAWHSVRGTWSPIGVDTA